MIQCGNSIMAATAAGGFRRYFGTGKSLSFVRPLCVSFSKVSASSLALLHSQRGALRSQFGIRFP
jgi:hypothetical protein